MSIVTRWWWIRHAPVPDGGRIYGQSDLDCDCGDVEIFRMLARELPRDAVWVTSNLVRTRQTAAAILAAAEPGRFAGVEPLAMPISPSSIWASGRAWSARPSMRSARSARTRSGSRPPRSARPAARASSISLERVAPVIERLTQRASRQGYRRRHARRHDPRRARTWRSA